MITVSMEVGHNDNKIKLNEQIELLPIATSHGLMKIVCRVYALTL